MTDQQQLKAQAQEQLAWSEAFHRGDFHVICGRCQSPHLPPEFYGVLSTADKLAAAILEGGATYHGHGEGCPRSVGCPDGPCVCGEPDPEHGLKASAEEAARQYDDDPEAKAWVDD